MKDFLHVGCLREKYRARIQTLIEQDADRLQAFLQEAVGVRKSDFLVDSAVLGRWDEIEATRRDVQSALVWRTFRRAPLRQAKDSLLFLWKRQRQYLLSPTGLFIVVLGTDGSGKTTVIREVMPLVEKLFPGMRRLAFNFKLLPHIGDLRNWVR